MDRRGFLKCLALGTAVAALPAASWAIQYDTDVSVLSDGTLYILTDDPSNTEYHIGAGDANGLIRSIAVVDRKSGKECRRIDGQCLTITRDISMSISI